MEESKKIPFFFFFFFTSSSLISAINRERSLRGFTNVASRYVPQPTEIRPSEIGVICEVFIIDAFRPLLLDGNWAKITRRVYHDLNTKLAVEMAVHLKTSVTHCSRTRAW